MSENSQSMPIRAYLDNAATMQMLPEAIDAVAWAMKEGLGNASARHSRGKRAKALLEESRAVIAEALDVEAGEVYFTSGGTEANNLAIVGACLAARRQSPERIGIIASTLEHPSVTKSVRGLKREGWEASYIRAPHGELDFDQLERQLSDRVAVVSVMRVQNEVGYLFDVSRVANMVHRASPRTLVHSDGVQAFGKVDFFPKELGLDMASICSHKIGGPQGIGALFVRWGTPVFTTAYGGGQERGLRSGTEAVPLAVGFACAVRLTMARRREAFVHVQGLKARLIQGLREISPDAVLNSRDDGSPYIVSFSVPGLNDELGLDYFSRCGICLSQASACETLHPNVPAEDWRSKHPTSLLLSGVSPDLLDSTFRVSFSPRTTAEEVDCFLTTLAELCAARNRR